MISQKPLNANENSRNENNVIGVSSFGERLRRYRDVAKLSTRQLAVAVNEKYGEKSISQSIIANIENGRGADVSFERIVQLAHALNVTPMVLIVDCEQPWFSDANPVFKGLLNYQIWHIFLLDTNLGTLPPPMMKPANIIGHYADYRTAKFYVQSTIERYEKIIDGEIEMYNPVDPYSTDPVDLEMRCDEALQNLKTARDRLILDDVKIPAIEDAQIQQLESEMFRVVNKSRRTNTVSEETIKQARREWYGDPDEVSSWGF
jgi:transcriptional regulator with XRE-family HTH domain